MNFLNKNKNNKQIVHYQLTNLKESKFIKSEYQN